MAKRTVAFHVEFELPPGATIGDAIEYIETALIAECGARHPDDPMSNFSRASVDVRPGRRVLSD